ncbi:MULTISPECIES: HNH endonuclease signature motif containing protein [Peribacillus]|uniref:HNH endonuclease signature motif containing protein n=1 Tax=Peribacillus TaxID=2675229 RepID=UPI001F4DFC30|nr:MULTISPECIES: HNH endonuclease signature motif containing protein [unclassified Peribacillus]MCK1983197.1 HNH endonuclease [Peribacillus sp. Aquil_B1]MCK2006214.1 HNH endonuclease [Peribacillus sp. Aquil_B8]
MKEAVKEFESLKGEMTPVPGFSRYLCHTPTGRVWSKVSNRWLIEDEFCKGTGDHGQYLMTSLKCDLTEEMVPMYKHEIVLSSAYGTTKDFWLSQGLQIDHIDKNPRNNKIENLRLITDVGNKKNSRDRYWNKTRLSMSIARELREEVKHLTSNMTKMDFYKAKGEELNVSFRSIQNIVLKFSYKEKVNQ